MLMTREELHEQVWSQPMRTLAAAMGISDVALAKRCKVANVPVPPRGWWARKEAGKAVNIQPLPPPPFAMANYFPAFDRAMRGAEGDGGNEPSSLAGPPLFRDLAEVHAEIRGAVGRTIVPPTLTAPHPIVARLLRQDAARTPAVASARYLPASNVRKFASAVQQRRLRVLSCILTELARLGCKTNGSTHAGERFSVKVGGMWVYMFLGVEGGASPSYFNSGRRGYKPPDKAQLRFDVVEHDDRLPAKQSWREDKVLLDQQVSDILTGFLFYVEEESRSWALQQYKWRCEERDRRAKEERLGAAKAEADRIARKEAATAARIEALAGGAEALERAARIRRYVAAVRAAYSEGLDTEPEELGRWVAWALAEADAIDPILSRRFVADLDL